MTGPTDFSRIAARVWDVAVIGAGPAGAVAAHDLARRGRSVLLLERSPFPRYKVCGGCLNLRALKALRASGLERGLWERGARPLDRFFLAGDDRHASVPLPGGAAISRATMDAFLLGAAREAGAATIAGAVASVEKLDTDSVQLRLRTNETQYTVQAGLCLAANGLHHDALKSVHGIRVEVSPSARVGAGTVFEYTGDKFGPGTIYMAVARHGYVGLVHVEGRGLNLAAAFDPDFLRDTGAPHVAAERVLREAGLPIPQGIDEAAWRGTPPLTRRAHPTALHRLLLIGDAAGYIEPFTGEGMAWAIESGRNAAAFVDGTLDAWTAGTPALWQKHYTRTFTTAQRRCRVIAAALRKPLLSSIAIRTLHAMPGIARPLVHSLNATPHTKEYAP